MPVVSWHYASLRVGTTLTEWKEPLGVLRPTNDEGLAVLSRDKPALSIPRGCMLTGSGIVPLLGCTVVLVFRCPSREGIILAQRTEPPAPGMTFVACNGRSVVHGVFHRGNWITTEGMSLPDGDDQEPIVSVYQYDVNHDHRLQLRYMHREGDLRTVVLSDDPLRPWPESPAPLTVGGYTATDDGAGPILGDTAVELHSLQVYESATDAEMEAIALEMAKEWVL